MILSGHRYTETEPAGNIESMHPVREVIVVDEYY